MRQEVLRGTKGTQRIDVDNVAMAVGNFDMRLRAPFGASIRRRGQERNHELRHEGKKRGETESGASTTLPKTGRHPCHTTTMLRLFPATRQCTAPSLTREAPEQRQHSPVCCFRIVELRRLDHFGDRRQTLMRHYAAEGSFPDCTFAYQLMPVTARAQRNL